MSRSIMFIWWFHTFKSITPNIVLLSIQSVFDSRRGYFCALVLLFSSLKSTTTLHRGFPLSKLRLKHNPDWVIKFRFTRPYISVSNSFAICYFISLAWPKSTVNASHIPVVLSCLISCLLTCPVTVSQSLSLTVNSNVKEEEKEKVEQSRTFEVVHRQIFRWSR